MPLIESLWYSFSVVGSAMFRVSQKLQKLKNPIREFSKDNYSNLEKRVREAHQVLLLSQNQMLSHPTTSNVEAEIEALRYGICLLR